ncbi:MAG: type III secretion system chaperone [Desulfovibrionaceae bacterium]|nr:type III secretion system chaperone [Desulfovibrionaceae bacterium]
MLDKFISLVETFSNENNMSINRQHNDTVIVLYIEKFPLTIFYNNNFITLQSGVALVPENGKEEFFKQLLILNNGLLETSGASFGFDTESDMVTLQFSCAITHVTQEEFNALLFNFIEVLAHFMQKICYNDLNKTEEHDTIPVTGIRI